MALRLGATVSHCPADILHKFIVTPVECSELCVLPKSAFTCTFNCRGESEYTHVHNARAHRQTHTGKDMCTQITPTPHTHAARMHFTGKHSGFVLGPENCEAEPTTNRNRKWGPQREPSLSLPQPLGVVSRQGLRSFAPVPPLAQTLSLSCPLLSALTHAFTKFPFRSPALLAWNSLSQTWSQPPWWWKGGLHRLL